jgi:pyruvate, water dikinase
LRRNTRDTEAPRAGPNLQTRRDSGKDAPMGSITQFLKRIVSRGGKTSRSAESIEELRSAFAARYHSFKLLITANHKALEIMTDMERTLRSGKTFGLAFVRSHCTAAGVNVFRMIKHLDELAPGKYTELFDRFKAIQARINEALVRPVGTDEGPLVVPLKDVNRDMADQVGSKMANIAEIHNAIDLPVPPGFVITVNAYKEFIRHGDLPSEIRRRIQTADLDKMDDLYRLSSELQGLIISAPVPPSVEQAILEAYKEVEKTAGKGACVSVRSSALGEDAEGRSFAGQFRSELNVSEDSLLQAYKTVAASKYGLPALTYRLNRGIPDEDVAMCVGCMAMIDASSGGVMYSSNPLNIRDSSIIINSVWGLPKAVVDGSVDPDVFVISKDQPMRLLEKRITDKELQYICYPDEGLCRMDLTHEKRRDQSLTDEQALDLARMAKKLEDYYGSPQDIEWAVTHDGSVYFLQCRPLKQFQLEPSQGAIVASRTCQAPVLASGGVTASSGVACGSVFIVRSDVDKLKFPEGSVLVTAQSLPGWAPLLGQAAAVITEIGGVAGHLANVAREFGVPALFGISGATRSFSNGQVVTVDADGLAVYEGCVDSLLADAKPKPNLMEGSPVYEALEKVSSQIIPLTLIDPESPHFHPKYCETLHDITRFVHEKSVDEMFSFGKEQSFPERSSKQLFYKVPMQWWIINLDDGFRQDVEGKLVELDNIVSIPMLAIWEGAVAVPWEGPPAVDARGFMSVLMQATTNTALDPTLSSPYAAKNYFMISKNFCSLASRFGFHFSTVEALVSERSSENYVSFSFKGGAADSTRRIRRAQFVGEFLEAYGFRVEIKEDSVFSRLEGRDEHFMKTRLKMLGYLIMHTRQLDMVMASGGEIARYRAKFQKDLSEILSVEDPTLPEQAAGS